MCLCVFDFNQQNFAEKYSDKDGSQKSKLSDLKSVISMQEGITRDFCSIAKKFKRKSESKKLVFLSNIVLEEVVEKLETTGTKIATRIL